MLSPKHVFMSYSRRDQAVMERVLKYLRKQGVMVWVDDERLIPGTPIWEMEIEKAIKNAAAILVICSPDSNESEWVRREITFAERYRKRIFPLLASGNEDSSISIRLSTRQYVDLRENEERGLKSLGTAVALHLDILERQEREERERKAAEEKAIKEQEERERKELEKKALTEKEAREAEERKRVEKREQEERARKATEEKARKEREERERREAAEKARKEKEERERKSTPPESQKQPVGWTSREAFQKGETPTKPKWLPYGIGGVVVFVLIFGGVYLIQNWPTLTLFSTPLPTNIPPASPSIGSTWVQFVDDMVLVYVPAGEFEMGSDVDDALAECQKFNDDCKRSWLTDEEPIHTVYLDAYWIDQTEVTNGMYAKCVESRVCDLPGSSQDKSFSYYGNSIFDDYPVIFVSWDDAVDYCKWAGRRLPTEAEWEKAAGWNENTQTNRLYPWGDSFDGTKVNFCDTNCTLVFSNADYDDGYKDIAPVGSYPAGASFYGALDMGGNVSEWVADWYDVYPGGDENADDLFGKTNRGVRGGSWGSSADSTRSASRGRFNPEHGIYYFGFRCARDAEL